MLLHRDLKVLYREVMGAFESLGYPAELLGQWALPERDAFTLLQKIAEVQPHNILEIGTFVGLTTLLMASVCSDQTTIHTVDPNFPLQVEMGAMRSSLYGGDCAVRAQELGKTAASRLGLHDRIVFHEGGFSTSSTFAGKIVNPADQVPVIGPELCRQYGPFDFVFVDGLHYESAVFSDLVLAADHLSPHGVIAMHDVMGRWGSNVRRAVFRFLTDRDDFSFFHGRYSLLYDAIGFLEQRQRDTSPPVEKCDPGLASEGLIQPPIIPNLAAVLFSEFSPASVVQIGYQYPGLAECLKELGVREICAPPLSGFPEEGAVTSNLTSRRKYDLCLCIGATEQLPAGRVDQLIRACVDCSNTIVFAVTPPGEMGTYQGHERPIAYWVRRFHQRGFVLHDKLRPILEPFAYFDEVFGDYRVKSSHLMNLYVAKREPRMNRPFLGRDFLEEILVSKESRIEDLALQSFYQNMTITDARRRLIELREQHDLLAEQRDLLAARHRQLLESGEVRLAMRLRRYPKLLDWLRRGVEKLRRVGTSRSGI